MITKRVIYRIEINGRAPIELDENELVKLRSEISEMLYVADLTSISKMKWKIMIDEAHAGQSFPYFNAIKQCHSDENLGLKEAKDAVNTYMSDSGWHKDPVNSYWYKNTNEQKWSNPVKVAVKEDEDDNEDVPF